MAECDILVRGGGAVGLTAALALSRRGLQVALLGARPAEPGTAAPGTVAPAPAEDVRAYALNRASAELLTSLKVWDAIPADARTAVHEMLIEGDAPGGALAFSAWTQALPQLAWIVDAAALDQALAEAVRYAPHVQRVEREVSAPLTVLAEGKDSVTRSRLGSRMQRHGYGQRAIACRLDAELPHAGIARQWFRAPDVLALLPLDRPRAGHGLALVWSVPEARAADLMALDGAAFAAALHEATAGAAGALALAGERVAWPLAIGHAEPLCGPGWVLVGDAAHVVHPLAGQGLNLGLADVASLVEVLAAREPWRALGDERLLARHVRARELPVRAMGWLTDGLLHLFSSPSPVVKELRNRGLGLVNHLPPLKRALVQRAIGR